MASVLRLIVAFLLCLGGLAMGELAWADDPPGRVGRLSLVAGGVVLRGADDARGTAAQLNWPLTDGDVLATDGDGRAEIRVGSTVLRLDGAGELAIQRIDDEHIRVWLEYGSLAVRVRNPDRANAVEVETRDGIAVAAEPGQYRMDAYPDGLALTAYRGRFRFQGRSDDVVVRGGERVELRDGELRVGPAEYDEFADWSLALDRRDDAREPPRYVSREMTGVEDLQHYGDWDNDAAYGPVWFPRAVPGDWAPYRWGRWIYVEPWGWTWVDDAPWGFAPFHYGRWVLVRGRWAWLPGSYVARPLYAPALVVWIGAPEWEVDFVFGRRHAVGWFPLGPREVYVPGYRCSTTYVRRINVTHVTEVTRITEVVRAPDRHRHFFRHKPRAVTVAPRDALAEAKAIAPLAVRDPEPWVREAPVVRTAPGLVERRAMRRHDGDRDFAGRVFSSPEAEQRVPPRESRRLSAPRERLQVLPEDDDRSRRKAERRRDPAEAGARREMPRVVESPARRGSAAEVPPAATSRERAQVRRSRDGADADASRRFQAGQRSPAEAAAREQAERRETPRRRVEEESPRLREPDDGAVRRFQAGQRSRTEAAAREQAERRETLRRRVEVESPRLREPDAEAVGRLQAERRNRAEALMREQAERSESLRRRAEGQRQREAAAAASRRIQAERQDAELRARARVAEAERRARDDEAPRIAEPGERRDRRGPVQLPQEPRRGPREAGGGAAFERFAR